MEWVTQIHNDRSAKVTYERTNNINVDFCINAGAWREANRLQTADTEVTVGVPSMSTSMGYQQ
jgi:hypothetical protein